MPANKQNRSRVRRSLKQFKAAYIGSLSQSANIERITGVNPTHQSSFTDLVEFSTLGIPHLTQQKIHEKFDNTALNNLLEGQTSTREKLDGCFFPYFNQGFG